MVLAGKLLCAAISSVLFMLSTRWRTYIWHSGHFYGKLAEEEGRRGGQESGRSNGRVFACTVNAAQR